MFVVSEADAAAIRALFRQRGELSATVELRRLFPGLDAETARECMHFRKPKERCSRHLPSLL